MGRRVAVGLLVAGALLMMLGTLVLAGVVDAGSALVVLGVAATLAGLLAVPVDDEGT